MIKPFPTSRQRAGGKARPGFTLIEVLVALVAGLMVAIAVMLTCVFVLRSFIAISNYADLDKSSRIALDNMDRNIRGAKSVTAFATNSISMTALDGRSFGYTYDSANRQLTYVTNNNTSTLLTNCDTLFFSYYQHNPTNNLQFVAATVTNEVKLVNVDWRCSRQIYGNKINTESVQTAQIAIRNY